LVLIPLALIPTMKIMAYPAPHSEIKSGKTTYYYGHPNPWRFRALGQWAKFAEFAF
jgi:hypothetical protein